MIHDKIALRTFGFAFLFFVAGTAIAQSYPSKTIHIVTAEPGGSNDFMARLIAQGLTGNLAQQVIVENRGGAGGIIAAQTVAKALPDGYTLLLYTGPLWLLPFMRDSVPYDPVRDFSGITLAARAPNVLVVNLALTVKSVEELIFLAQTRPGELNFGTSGSGAGNHLAAELFKSMARVNLVRIPYKGAGPALNELISGQLQLMFPAAVLAAPHVKSNRLRALAVTSAQPSALFPRLPTVAASGLPDYESAAMFGVFAPARTPLVLVNRLNQEFVRVLNRADVRERLFNAGAEVVGSSPEHLAAAIRSEMAKLGKLILEAGIRDE